MNDAAEVEVEEVEVDTVETEEVDATETEAEDVAKDEEKPEPEDSSTSKKEDGVQKRIDELTKIRRETERDRDYWKNIAQQTQVAPEPVEPGKTLADFEYDEGKYAAYLTDLAKADAKAEVERQIQSDKAARSMAEFTQKESDFAKDVDDYHTVTRNNDLKITGEMVEALQGSSEGPAVLYYLGKNPEVADMLANMSPLNMARELGRIESTKLVKGEPSTTKAPAPTPKIAGVAKSTTVKATVPASDTLSTEEWLKRRNKSLRS